MGARLDAVSETPHPNVRHGLAGNHLGRLPVPPLDA